MRRIALCATLALSLLGAQSASAGVPTTVNIDAHITPLIRIFSPKPQTATLAINLKFQGQDGQPAATLTKAVLNFPFGAHLNGQFFPACSADMIRNHKPCPKGSLIGTGKARGALGDAIEDLTVKLYNGKGGKSITFFLEGDRPAVIAVPFDAPLRTFKSGDWNYDLTVNVPEILQRIVGIDVSLDYFNVKVGANRVVKGKKHGYIETVICPPGALVPIRAAFSFLEAPDFKTDTYIHCGGSVALPQG
jgi:hypothetical protein